MREPTPEASYMREPTTMYGRPMHHPKHQAAGRPVLPFQSPAAGPFMSERGFSRGPLLSSEEAESQQVHPIILMLNLPYKEQQPTSPAAGAQLMFMGQAPTQSRFAHPVETAIQPIFMPMPYAATSPRQNPYYKSRDQPAYSSPFAQHKNHHHHYYPQQPADGYYAPVAQPPHPYPMQPAGSAPGNYRPVAAAQRYNHRMTNTIEVPIEIHHQVAPSVSPQAAQAQIIVQPQIETQSQPNESGDQDQSAENEHHMVVFYSHSDADNMNHSEENASGPEAPNAPNGQPAVEATSTAAQPPNQPPVFIKESKQINSDLEKANHQVGKMLLLHFVGNQPEGGQVAPPAARSFSLIQPEQIERQPPNSNKMEESAPRMSRPIKEPIRNEAKNEEETTISPNEQANREELYERPEPNPNAERDEPEPASLAQFAQVIRHVIDQQQQNQEQQQAPVMRQAMPPQQAASGSQATTQPQAPSANPNAAAAAAFQPVQFPPQKEQPVENSNKETEKAQESIQTPAFMLVSDDEN